MSTSIMHISAEQKANIGKVCGLFMVLGGLGCIVGLNAVPFWSISEGGSVLGTGSHVDVSLYVWGYSYDVSVSILGETASGSSAVAIFSDCDLVIELEGQNVYQIPLDDSLCDPWQTSAKLAAAVGVLALGLCCASMSIYKSGGSLGHLVIAAAVATMCGFIKSQMSDAFNSSSSDAGAGFSVALGLCIAYGVIAGLQLLVVASDFSDNTGQRSGGYAPLANSPGSVQTAGNNVPLSVYAPQPAAPQPVYAPQPAATPPAPQATNFCPSCRTSVAIEAQFCPYCGNATQPSNAF